MKTILLDHLIIRLNLKPLGKVLFGSIFLFSLVVFLVFGAGCATNNSPAFNYAPDDQTEAARDLTVPPGKSVIYVYDQMQLGPAQMILQLDQKDVCRLAKRTFYRAVLEPGSHQLALRYEGNWVDSAGQVQAPIRIGKEYIVNAEAGHVYYYRGKVLSLGGEVKIEFKECFGFEGKQHIQRSTFHLTGELINP